MRETINLVITETGRTVFHQSSKQGWSFLQELFNDFSDEELTTLWQLLQKVYAFNGKVQDDFEAEGREL